MSVGGWIALAVLTAALLLLAQRLSAAHAELHKTQIALRKADSLLAMSRLAYAVTEKKLTEGRLARQVVATAALGLASPATPDQVRRRSRALTLALHPDRAEQLDPETRKELSEALRSVTLATAELRNQQS